MKTLSGDPVTNSFNEWLRNYGMYVAIGVAAVLLIIIVVLLILNKTGKKPEKEAGFEKNSADFVGFLGGKENIVSVSKTGSRIALTLKDYGLVDEAKLKEAGVLSIIKMSNKITLVLSKGDVESVFNSLN